MNKENPMNNTTFNFSIPVDVYDELKRIMSARKIELNRLILEAVSDKIRKIRSEDAFIQEMNEALADPEIDDEYHQMAELIIENTDVRELPW
jgi:hypothetical protein